MLTKNVKYTDFNGEEREEECRFNYTETELVQMQASASGGMSEKLSRIIKTRDPKELMATMKEFIIGAYGVKSDDGKKFIKNDKVREDFESSPAFDVVFMELITDANASAAFVNGVLPAKISEVIKEQTEKNGGLLIDGKLIEIPSTK